MEITLEEIQKKFESLPEDVRWAIMGANVDENIIDIGKAQGLNVEQMGQLSLETHMVMFGFTPPDKFEESVRNSMKLGDEKTRAVVNAVNEKILKEIRTKMMEASGVNVKKTDSIDDTDGQILDKAGIQIISEPEKSTSMENAGEKKFKEDMNSILAKKLSTPTQNPVVRTEHTLDNITKGPNTPPVTPVPPIPPSSIMGNIKPASSDTTRLSPSYAKGADPYRMKPE